MTTPKISLRDITKRFDAITVLDAVSLDIESGSVVSIIGPSGSGKSTLLRCINLLEHIDDGELLLDGTDISIPGFDPNTVRRRIGMVFQSYNLFPHMSVLDNITLALRRVLGLSRVIAQDRARELLTRFALDDKENAFPDQMSGGQQQRAAIARAVAMEPEVLLLDEITSALDPELVGEVLDVVRELRSTGMTIVLATHEMGFARDTSDLVCVLDGGRIIESGSPAQVFGAPQQERTQQFLQRVINAGRL
ncbi:MAG: amino acid ABC transporter ATP-binding protein [Ilumatobacteraceae bacterium]|nr:amino acid ABC transporter ATP-binding protein [Ilumatobacteraceae bacterium]